MKLINPNGQTVVCVLILHITHSSTHPTECNAHFNCKNHSCAEHVCCIHTQDAQPDAVRFLKCILNFRWFWSMPRRSSLNNDVEMLQAVLKREKSRNHHQITYIAPLTELYRWEQLPPATFSINVCGIIVMVHSENRNDLLTTAGNRAVSIIRLAKTERDRSAVRPVLLASLHPDAVSHPLLRGVSLAHLQACRREAEQTLFADGSMNTALLVQVF